MQQLRDAHKSLTSMFNMQHALFTSGSTEVIKQLFCIFGSNLYAYPGQHPLVDKLTQQQTADVPKKGLACLINFVDGTTGEYHYKQLQDARKRFKYVIVDCTQSIGKKVLPSDIQIDCLFFSGHKFGAVFGTGFLLCSNEFYTNFLHHSTTTDTEQDEDLTYNGTINYPAYLTTVNALQHIDNYNINAY